MAFSPPNNHILKNQLGKNCNHPNRIQPMAVVPLSLQSYMETHPWPNKVLNHLNLPTISLGKVSLRGAFAGALVTLSLHKSALGTEIQLSERSEFWISVPVFSRFLQA